jgi:hypothetical protein
LVAPVPSGYEETANADAKVAEALHNSTVFEHAGEFDVLANHFDFMPLTYSRLVSTPMVTTIHGFSSPKIVPVYRAFDDIAHYVAISDADRMIDAYLTLFERITRLPRRSVGSAVPPPSGQSIGSPGLFSHAGM